MLRAAGPACGFLAVLNTVALTYAATQAGDAAVDGLLAGPATVFHASPPSRYPPSWAARYVARHPQRSVFAPLAWLGPRHLIESQAPN